MPVLTKINTNSIAEDAITGDKFAGDAYLANTANQNISGTYSENRLYTSDAYTLSGNATVNGHLTLSSIKPTADVVLTAGGAYTLTGTGVLSAGSLLAKERTDLTDMTGELGSSVTQATGFTLGSGVTGGSGLTALGTVTSGTIGSGVTFPAGHLLKVQNFPGTIGYVSSTSDTYTGNAIANANYTPNGGSNNLSYLFAILSAHVEVVTSIAEGRITCEVSITGADITNNIYNVVELGGMYGLSGRSYGGLIHTTKTVQLDGTGHANIEWQFSLKNVSSSASSTFGCQGATTSVTVFEYQG